MHEGVRGELTDKQGSVLDGRFRIARQLFLNEAPGGTDVRRLRIEPQVLPFADGFRASSGSLYGVARHRIPLADGRRGLDR